MSKKYGKCTNFGGYCRTADNKEEIEILDEQEFVCPECGFDLHPIKNKDNRDRNIPIKKISIFALPIILILIWLWSKDPHPEGSGGITEIADTTGGNPPPVPIDTTTIIHTSIKEVVTNPEWKEYVEDSIRINENNLWCKESFNIALQSLRVLNNVYLKQDSLIKAEVLSLKNNLLDIKKQCD